MDSFRFTGHGNKREKTCSQVLLLASLNPTLHLPTESQFQTSPNLTLKKQLPLLRKVNGCEVIKGTVR
jgi:hypothetical protein